MIVIASVAQRYGCVKRRCHKTTSFHNLLPLRAGMPLIRSTAQKRVSIKAKLGGNCPRCCHIVPVLPIGQQVLYFLSNYDKIDWKGGE
nr:MAG TPA: hypothetical protein [Caudoviricetes sp.]